MKKTAKSEENSEKAIIEQVEQMKISARLNALKTLIDYYNIQIANPNNPETIILKAKEKSKETIQEIDALINSIGDDELESS